MNFIFVLSQIIRIIINIMEKPTQNLSVTTSQTVALTSILEPMNSFFPDLQLKLGEQNLGPAEILENKPRKHQLKLRMKERTRVKSQVWSHTEIRKIFRLYSEYGSQWKIIETQFQDRCANSIKNRFYTVVRTLLKLLFKWHPQISEKLPHEIPSKIILKIYEGRLEFARFKGLAKRILKMIDFNLESKGVKRISQQNEEQLLSLYKMIFERRTLEQIKLEISQPQKEQDFPTDNVYEKNENNGQPYPLCTEVEHKQTQVPMSLQSSNFTINSHCEGIVYFFPYASYYPSYLALF